MGTLVHINCHKVESVQMMMSRMNVMDELHTGYLRVSDFLVWGSLLKGYLPEIEASASLVECT